ncbi:hypothetical protein POG22_12320 [Geitlerinema sp. CS-897]|nr:hypothetical protein [Geitlerinema sp. CS-897]
MAFSVPAILASPKQRKRRSFLSVSGLLMWRCDRRKCYFSRKLMRYRRFILRFLRIKARVRFFLNCTHEIVDLQRTIEAIDRVLG